LINGIPKKKNTASSKMNISIGKDGKKICCETAGPFGTFGNINKSLIDLWKTDPFHGDGANNPNSTTPNWSFTGPLNSTYGATPPSNFNGIGRCDKIAFHPTDPNIIYIGTPVGGLWRTTNGGTSWSVLTSYLPISGVSGIVVSYADPNTLYILSGNGDNATGGFATPTAFTSAGVFKSTDAGTTWTQLTVPWPDTIGVGAFQLVQSPKNPNILMMATTRGLYRTTNGGTSWTSIYTVKCYDIEFVRNSDTCYAILESPTPLKRSVTSGNTWSNISFGPGINTPIPVPVNRMQLAVSTVPVAVGGYERVYLFCGPATGAGTFSGLYKMVPENYMSLVRNTPNLYDNGNGSGTYDQSGYDNCAAVHPTNSNIMVTGGAIVFRTTDGGVTMSLSTFYSEVAAGGDLTKYIHPDIHDLAFNPLNNYLYAATDGGVYRSTDNGVSWTDITIGITTSMFYDIDGFEGNEFTLLGGLQDNGNKFRQTNTSDMLHIGCCDGYFGKIQPSNSAVAYVSANQWLIRYDALPTTATTGIEPPIGNGGWSWRMMTDQVDGNYVYTSHTYNDSIWISNNAGTSWFKRRKANGNRAIVTCPSNLNRVYATGSGPTIWDLPGTTLKRSEDKGETWTVNLLTNPGIPSPLQSAPSDLEVNPLQSSEVYLSFEGLIEGVKVYRSTNAGATWTNVSYNLPNIPVNTLAVDDAAGVYAGTDYGVFYKPAGATAWIFYGNNLPRTIVTDLYLNRTFNVLYAATFGRGIWKTNAYAACDPLLLFTGAQTGQRMYEAQHSIWSWAEIQGGKQANVFYKAGDSIKLLNGFIANEDITEFKATLGPCGTGYPPLTKISDTTQINLQKLSLPTTVKSAHPFGSFRIVKSDIQQVETELSILKEGDFEMRLTDKQGHLITQLQKKEKWTEGKLNRAFNFPRLPKDLYYVHLIYNGMLVHFQELDLR
jgi:photosystem II stability/assembly factor-like uncharacterized protein